MGGTAALLVGIHFDHSRKWFIHIGIAGANVFITTLNFHPQLIVPHLPHLPHIYGNISSLHFDCSEMAKQNNCNRPYPNTVNKNGNSVPFFDTKTIFIYDCSFCACASNTFMANCVYLLCASVSNEINVNMDLDDRSKCTYYLHTQNAERMSAYIRNREKWPAKQHMHAFLFRKRQSFHRAQTQFRSLGWAKQLQ